MFRYPQPLEVTATDAATRKCLKRRKLTRRPGREISPHPNCPTRAAGTPTTETILKRISKSGAGGRRPKSYGRKTYKTRNNVSCGNYHFKLLYDFVSVSVWTRRHSPLEVSVTNAATRKCLKRRTLTRWPGMDTCPNRNVPQGRLALRIPPAGH